MKLNLIYQNLDIVPISFYERIIPIPLFLIGQYGEYDLKEHFKYFEKNKYELARKHEFYDFLFMDEFWFFDESKRKIYYETFLDLPVDEDLRKNTFAILLKDIIMRI